MKLCFHHSFFLPSYKKTAVWFLAIQLFLVIHLLFFGFVLFLTLAAEEKSCRRQRSCSRCPCNKCSVNTYTGIRIITTVKVNACSITLRGSIVKVDLITVYTITLRCTIIKINLVAVYTITLRCTIIKINLITVYTIIVGIRVSVCVSICICVCVSI